jgi:hypothetical protein
LIIDNLYFLDSNNLLMFFVIRTYNISAQCYQLFQYQNIEKLYYIRKKFNKPFKIGIFYSRTDVYYNIIVLPWVTKFQSGSPMTQCARAHICKCGGYVCVRCILKNIHMLFQTYRALKLSRVALLAFCHIDVVRCAA